MSGLDRASHPASERNTSDEQTVFRSASSKRRKTEISSREIDQLYGVSPPALKRSSDNAPFKKRHSKPTQPTTTISMSTRPVYNREENKKQNLKARIENVLGRKFDQIFTPWADEDQNVSRGALYEILKVIGLMKENSPQKIARTLNRALNGGDGKRRLAGGRQPTGACFVALAADLRSTKAMSVNGAGSATPSFPSESNRQQLDRRSSRMIEDDDARDPQQDARSNPLEDSHHQLDQNMDMTMSYSTVLPQHKQDRTTLVVRVAPSAEYLPLKLSECMTLRAFYSKILGAWDLSRETVEKITTTFTWMAPEDKMRTMMMNSAIEGCFAHLVEQVDDAPSWEDGGKGKCVLEVDVVLKVI